MYKLRFQAKREIYLFSMLVICCPIDYEEFYTYLDYLGQFEGRFLRGQISRAILKFTFKIGLPEFVCMFMTYLFEP